MKKIVYSEPADYFPESVRKEFELGEYNTDVQDENCEKLNKRPNSEKA